MNWTSADHTGKCGIVDDLKKQNAGVKCRKDKGIVDEIPRAYKDIEKVMQAQSVLVEIVAELKQIICVKG